MVLLFCINLLRSVGSDRIAMVSSSYYVETPVVAANRPFSHCFCACVYRSRDALFLDNRRDFTKMGQTDFEPLTLSM